MLQPVLCLTALLAGTTALAEGVGDPPPAKLTKEEQRLLDLTNEVRKKENLPPLTVNPLLVEVARKHSQTMAMKHKLAHEIDGARPAERLKAAGYKFFAFGENIHESKRKGVDAADAAVKWWLNSEKHRENILDKQFTEIGVGMATTDAGETFSTQVFGMPRK
jgi:uncharacterized protein YkwD